MTGSQPLQPPGGGTDLQPTAGAGRFAAAIIDNLVLPVTSLGTASIVDRGLGGVVLGTVLLVLVTVVAEARTGRTPGKAIVGLRTRRASDGSDLDVPTALARRPWPLLFGMGQVVSLTLGLGLVVLFVVGSSLRFSRNGTGLHDRLTDTEVVAAPTETATRQLGLLVVAALIVGTLVRLLLN